MHGLLSFLSVSFKKLEFKHPKVQLYMYTVNSGLEITAGQRTMSGLIGELTGQPFVLPVMLTGHIPLY